jgi:hypothetical protein
MNNQLKKNTQLEPKRSERSFVLNGFCWEVIKSYDVYKTLKWLHSIMLKKLNA